ncbi:serine proteinase stubble [Schistocerca serialis cubense]|uniref:serine proteinase stubble n=1 Tax=Schistocerca serialis cubense TaxID=2023355 RepID=UPI00214E2C7C|nr:serine proteinase stubble [Schistocerca serialis cubense]
MSAWRLVVLLLATVIASSSPAASASTYASSSGGRLLSSLLGYPSSCRHNAAAYRCTLTFTCWLVGGQLTPGCSSSGGPLDVVADLLFTCCVPAHHSHPPPPPGLPSRREDIDHRNNQLLDVTSIECGTPQLTFQKRIIGGNEAYFGEFPWQAHIRIAGYQCGGVLVSQWYVATAAHCIHRARLKDIIVFLGEYDTQNTGQYMEPLPEETFRVIKKIIHPNFQFRITQPDRFDLALLRLSRPVFYRENILPICLPKHNEAFMGHTGVVAGWGKTDTTYGKTGTNILQKATVPILSDEECLKWHEHKNINLELYSEMFCAGHSDGHMDACLGDSGGPLIVKVNGRWTLAGITSAGFGCAVDHQPGIYHKVADTAHWIVAHVEGKK